MQQSPSWEADRPLASQGIPTLCRTRKLITAFTSAHHLYPSWARSVQSMPPPSYTLKIHFNIILPSEPGSPSLRFLNQNPVHTPLSSHTCHMARPSHYSWSDHANNVWWRKRSLNSSLWVIVHSLVTSSLIGPNIFLSILFSNTQPMILTQCERPSFAPKYNNNKLFISKSLCFLYLLLLLQMQCHHCKNGVLSVVQILHRYYAQAIQCKSGKGRVGAW